MSDLSRSVKSGSDRRCRHDRRVWDDSGHQREFVQLTVAIVQANEAGALTVTPTPPVQAFMGVLAVAPPDGLEPPTRTLGRCRSIH
jgi:hypothetical protein